MGGIALFICVAGFLVAIICSSLAAQGRSNEVAIEFRRLAGWAFAIGLAAYLIAK